MGQVRATPLCISRANPAVAGYHILLRLRWLSTFRTARKRCFFLVNASRSFIGVVVCVWAPPCRIEEDRQDSDAFECDRIVLHENTHSRIFYVAACMSINNIESHLSSSCCLDLVLRLRTSRHTQRYVKNTNFLCLTSLYNHFREKSFKDRLWKDWYICSYRSSLSASWSELFSKPKFIRQSKLEKNGRPKTRHSGNFRFQRPFGLVVGFFRSIFVGQAVQIACRMALVDAVPLSPCIRNSVMFSF